MFKFARDFWSSKTTWTAIIAIVGSFGAWQQHQITLQQFLIAVFSSFFGVSLRDTVAKGFETLNNNGQQMLKKAEQVGQPTSPKEASLIPGFPLTLGNLLPLLELLFKHHNSTVGQTVANTIHTLNDLGQQAPQAPPTPVGTVAPATPAEPTDGEADAAQ